MIVSEHEIHMILRRVAVQIIETVTLLQVSWDQVILLGIKRRGIPLCERIASLIEGYENIQVIRGSVDVSLYRDDLTEMSNEPLIHSSEFSSLTGKTVFLIDDICNSGITAHAAVDAVMDLSKPKIIKYFSLVLTDCRILPVMPDYYGMKINTMPGDNIKVMVKEIDGADGISVLREQK